MRLVDLAQNVLVISRFAENRVVVKIITHVQTTTEGKHDPIHNSLPLLGLHKPLQKLPPHITPVLPLPCIFLSDLNLPYKPAIFIEGFPQSIPMNVLVWQLPPSGCTTHFIVLVFFSTSTDEFLTKGGLFFSWSLVPISSLWVICTPSYINNSIASGLKLLKRFWWCPTETLHPVGVHQFKEEPSIKIIYRLLSHNPSIFIIVHFPACRDLIFKFCGSFSPGCVSFRYIFTISNHTSF